MNFNKTKNASRNIVFGLIQRFYQLIVPFIMRTAMIYWLGVEYLGLDGLFTSILSVLNLAELGVGSAMVYSMYKPVADDDKTKICALMKLYKVYYRFIGLVILVAGLIICPFIPNLISDDLPNNVNVYVLYLLNLFATVLSYWLFAYKNSLFQAYQRADIISKVTIAVNTIRYILQFLILFIFHNYYLYLIITLASQAGINIVTAIVANRKYPGLIAKGEISKKEKKHINRQISDLFTSKLGSVVVNSVDTLVISAFLGLKILAIYQNYYYIMTAVLSIINIFIFSCTSGIGNSIIVEKKEKVFSDFKTFTFIIVSIAIFCTACLVCVFQPFMQIWVGKNLMFDFSAVLCFAVYFFIVQVNTLLNNYKDAAGIWHEDRFRPLITAIANLIMNLIMVHICGIYGILFSTILSMLIVGIPWLLHNLFSTIFEKKYIFSYVKTLLLYVICAIFVIALSYFFVSLLPFNGFLLIFLAIAICAVVSLVLILMFFNKKDEFKNTLNIVERITHNKFKFNKKN